MVITREAPDLKRHSLSTIARLFSHPAQCKHHRTPQTGPPQHPFRQSHWGYMDCRICPPLIMQPSDIIESVILPPKMHLLEAIDVDRSLRATFLHKGLKGVNAIRSMELHRKSLWYLHPSSNRNRGCAELRFFLSHHCSPLSRNP